MELDDLRVFVETVRRGSLSLAAANLGMSQPTVSRRIGRLEAEVGTALLERTRPAVTPTRRGLEFLTFAETTLARWEELRPGPSGTAAPRRLLHVASSTTPAESFLPGLLAAFAQTRPDIRAHIHVMNSDSVDECVRGRHCDVAFLGRPSRNPRLRTMAVAEDEVVLAVPRGHPLASRAEVSPEELADQTFVAREPGSATRLAVEGALSGHATGGPPPHASLEVRSGTALLAAVADGRGIGFVSALVVAASAAPVRILRLSQAPIRRTLVLVHDPRGLSAEARAFVAFVGARLPLAVAGGPRVAAADATP